jgi:plasmid replication initiation protein
MQNQLTPADRVRTMAQCAARRRHIEHNALPGESYAQAQTRLADRAEHASPPGTVRASMLRTAPEGDEQSDLFTPPMWDISTKDSRSMMDVAVFRLSKRDNRPGETIHYALADGFIEVKAGPDGMASVWDYDIILMAISYLTEAMNRYRDGRGDKPGRLLRPSVMEILKFCRRPVGGRQYEELESALDRLKSTSLKIVRTRRGRNGRVIRMAEGEGLLSNYRVLSYAENGVVASVEMEVPNWIYREVVEAKQPEILTVHPDYFLIEPGIGRYLYRLARRVAGRGRARWSFKLIYERSGSTGTFKEFCRMLRKQIQINDLPEYTLTEEAGKSGPMLVIMNRNAQADDLSVTIEGDDILPGVDDE